MHVVVARSFLKIRARDSQRVTHIEVAKAAQKIDLAAALTAGLDAVELDIVELRLIVHVDDVRQEEIVGRQAQIAGNGQLAGATANGPIGIQSKQSPIAQFPRRAVRATGRIRSPADQETKASCTVEVQIARAEHRVGPRRAAGIGR